MTTPATSSTPTTPAPADPGALRIVLFGMPDAGKSSLLGALAQAAQTQERQLQGRLFDVTSGLAELQRRVYEDKPRETLQEIVPYPVRFEPFRGTKPDPSQRLDAVLYDCDGRVANEVLTQNKALHDPRAGHLVDAIRSADALILVVDASNTDEQIEADFREFVRFLRHLEKHRTQGSEVGGLPVFLVLTKCDLLAKPGQAPSTWNEKIAERKAHVEARFKEYLEGEDEETAAFGSLDLHAQTTAVRGPAFQGAGAAREPFGVADLFRQAFHAARDYRQRLQSSHRRLIAIAAGATVFVTLLVGGAIALVLTRETIQPVALTGTVESYRTRENPTPSARLTEPLQRKISELTDIQRHPDFPKLPDDLKRYVQERLRELTVYQEYKARLERERPPAEMRTPEELNRRETRLRESLKPPAEFEKEWSQTEAELLRQKWIDDIAAMHKEAGDLSDRFAGYTQRGTDLLQFKGKPGVTLPWSEWHDGVRELLAEAGRQPYPESEPLRGSRPLPALRAPAVTYAAVYAFRTVEDARLEWEAIRNKVERLRDLSLAVGLAGDGSPETAPLKLPDKFTVDHVRTRLELLKKNYPKHADWSFQELSPVAASDVRLAAQRSYQRLIAAGQQVVLSELARISPDGRETHERWKMIARWLPDAPELREWGQLIKILQRFMGEPQSDPAATLATFLQQPNFSLKFNTIRLTIPDAVHDSRLRPTGKLAIVHHPAGGAPIQLQFQRQDEEQRDNVGRTTAFGFRQEGDQALTFSPGDTFYAELAVRDADNKERRVTWNEARSDLYRFECLHSPRQPRLHAAGSDATTGDRKDIRLSFTPEGGVPRVPDLMPVVTLKR